MCKFSLMYADGTRSDIDDVIKVEYVDTLGNDVIIQGDDLLTHKYPIAQEMHFIGEKSTYLIAEKSIKGIKITK